VRSARAPRLRALGAAVLTAGVVASGLVVHTPASAAPPVTESSASLKAEIARINAEMSRVSGQLAEGARAYEEAEERLAVLTQQQFAATADREALVAAEADSRSALQEMARAAYKGNLPPVLTALMSGSPRALSDLEYVQRSVNRAGGTQSALTDALVVQQVGAGRAVQRSDSLRRQALKQRQELDQQHRALAAETTRLTAELSAAGTRLLQAFGREQAAARAKAAAAELAASDRAAALARQQAAAAGVSLPPGDGGGGLCQPPSSVGAVNGFLPETSLCPLASAPGHRLRSDAARAFDALSAARQAATGSALCVTDSYRSYAAQVDVFRRKPELAATPGRSQHGWGLAVDLCGGVQTFGSEAHGWMQANAAAYGWIHPGWARQNGSRPEAWHWEFVGLGNATR
jgi:predicted  nucleic acid-binding Zn-ribbon protein